MCVCACVCVCVCVCLCVCVYGNICCVTMYGKESFVNKKDIKRQGCTNAASRTRATPHHARGDKQLQDVRAKDCTVHRGYLF